MPNKFRKVQQICEEIPEPTKDSIQDPEAFALALGEWDLAQRILMELAK